MDKHKNFHSLSFDGSSLECSFRMDYLSENFRTLHTF